MRALASLCVLAFLGAALVSAQLPTSPAPPQAPNSDAVCFPASTVRNTANWVTGSTAPTAYKQYCVLTVTNTSPTRFNEQSVNGAQWQRSRLCGNVILYLPQDTALTDPGPLAASMAWGPPSDVRAYVIGSSNTQLWMEPGSTISGWAAVSAWASSGNVLPSALIWINPQAGYTKSSHDRVYLKRIGLCGALPDGGQEGNPSGENGLIDGLADNTNWYNSATVATCGDGWTSPTYTPAIDRYKGAPRLVHAEYVNMFSVSFVNFKNSPHFTLYLSHMQSVWVNGIITTLPNFMATRAPDAEGCNIDGVDLTFTYGATVQNSAITSGDDGIAVKWMNANVKVSRVILYGGHGFTTGNHNGGAQDGGTLPSCNYNVQWKEVTGVFQRQGVSMKTPPALQYDNSAVLYEDVCLVNPRYAINMRTVDTSGKDAKGTGTRARTNVQINGLKVTSAGQDSCEDYVGIGLSSPFGQPYVAKPPKKPGGKKELWNKPAIIGCSEADCTKDGCKSAGTYTIACTNEFQGSISGLGVGLKCSTDTDANGAARSTFVNVGGAGSEGPQPPSTKCPVATGTTSYASAVTWCTVRDDDKGWWKPRTLNPPVPGATAPAANAKVEL